MAGSSGICYLSASDLAAAESETILYCDQAVGVSAILPQKIRGLSLNQRESGRQTPVIAKRLRVLALRPGAITVVADCDLKSNIPTGVDRITRASQDRAGHSAVRIEVPALRSPTGDDISAVTSHEKPFPGLSFELDDVKDMFVRTGVARREISSLRLD